MTMPNHVYLVIAGYKGISKVQRTRFDPEDFGKILGVYPSEELAKEHADKLTETIKKNMTRLFREEATVRDAGRNKIIIVDADDSFSIHWVSIECYEVNTEVKIE